MTTRIATAAGAGPNTRFFVPFTKVEENADGSVYVEGIATGEVLDFHGEVVSYEASKKAFEEWSAWAEKVSGGESLGNIRVMHQPIVAGKAVKWWADDATRSIYLGSKIEDPVQAKMCRSRAYTGYSIGGDNVVREMGDWEGKLVPYVKAYRLAENSIVDKGACPTATFTLVKRAATQEIAAMKPIEFLKAHFPAVLLCAVAMPEKDTLKLSDGTIEIVEKDGAVDLELRKDAGSAVAVAGADALNALKKFMIEVLGMDGDPDLWTIGDICEAMRYCYSARMGAQYAVADEAIAAAAAATDLKKSEHTEEEETEVSELPVEGKETDPPKAPELAAPAVPPAAPEPEKQAAVDLGPVLEAIAKIATSIEPLTKALREGGLSKAAGSEVITQLVKDVDAIKTLTADVPAIKKAIEKLPAPPAGSPVRKTIGLVVPSTGDGLTPEIFEKVVERLESTGQMGPGEQGRMRMALATLTMQHQQR